MGTLPTRVAICKVSPMPEDHFVSSGLWFHSHSGPSAGVAKVSRPVSGFTRPAPQGRFGNGYVAPQPPLLNVKDGQPSFQVTGASEGMRPPGYASRNDA